ncbi:Gfo/Idh/MocA family oxidoreductase, partial [Halomonas sp. BBD48]|nr:Gfo/Idh/MocA family oxidoreductase [Halomonas sp. BBD48]
GMPQAILLDLSARRDGARIDDDFHALLDYGDMRVVLHAAALVAAESPRFTLHGTRGSYVKFGLDPQEDRLKAGEAPAPSWGEDERHGQLTVREGEGEQAPLVSSSYPTRPGDYLAYYVGVRDALRGEAENPVPAEEALAVMQLLEAGLDSSRQQRWVRLK